MAEDPEVTPAVAAPATPRRAGSVPAWVTGAAAIGSRVLVLGTLVAILVLGGFLAFYLMQDADRALSAATVDLDSDDATAVRKRAAWATRQVGAYLRANLLTAVSSAVADGAYLALLGVPLAGP